MKVYIAYEGDLDRHGRQYYDIIGVYADEAGACNAVQQTITESGIDVSHNIVNGIPTTWWIEHGMDIVNVGMVEEHILISDEMERGGIDIPHYDGDDELPF